MQFGGNNLSLILAVNILKCTSSSREANGHFRGNIDVAQSLQQVSTMPQKQVDALNTVPRSAMVCILIAILKVWRGTQ